MQNEINAITDQLQQIFTGESIPSFKDEEFKSQLNAILSVAALDANEPQSRAAFELLGLKVAQMLLVHLQSGMFAERTVKVMRNQNTH